MNTMKRARQRHKKLKQKKNIGEKSAAPERVFNFHTKGSIRCFKNQNQKRNRSRLTRHTGNDAQCTMLSNHVANELMVL